MQLCTNPGRGGVSIISFAGSTRELSRIDELVGKNELRAGDLVYGWLKDRNGHKLDEVLLSAPDNATRILTGHGGTANTLALLAFFREMGFVEKSGVSPDTPTKEANFSDSGLSEILPLCQTEAQVAVILSEFNNPAPDYMRIANALKMRKIALIGAPNCGKSSLMNLLCDQQRALVSEVAGTTLDHVVHHADIGGFYCQLCDTAGFRGNTGAIESTAIERSQELIKDAEVIIHLFDQSRPLSEEDQLALALLAGKEVIAVINKAEEPDNLTPSLEKFPLISSYLAENKVLPISCHRTEGIELVQKQLIEKLGGALLTLCL